jgi:hypothetical protein
MFAGGSGGGTTCAGIQRGGVGVTGRGDGMPEPGEVAGRFPGPETSADAEGSADAEDFADAVGFPDPGESCDSEESTGAGAFCDSADFRAGGTETETHRGRTVTGTGCGEGVGEVDAMTGDYLGSAGRRQEIIVEVILRVCWIDVSQAVRDVSCGISGDSCGRARCRAILKGAARGSRTPISPHAIFAPNLNAAPTDRWLSVIPSRSKTGTALNYLETQSCPGF